MKRELPIEKSLMFALIHGLILYTPCHGNTLLLLLSPTRVASFKDFEWTGRFNSPTHVTSYGTGSWDWELVSGVRSSGPRTQIDPRIPGSIPQKIKIKKLLKLTFLHSIPGIHLKFWPTHFSTAVKPDSLSMPWFQHQQHWNSCNYIAKHSGRSIAKWEISDHTLQSNWK